MLSNSQPSIKRNYLYNLAYQILTFLTPVITTPYVSRVLGADGVGIYSYTSSVMAYLSMIATLGTATYGAREIARLRDDRALMSKAFWEIEILTLLSTMVCLLLWVVLVAYSHSYKYYFVALLPVLIATAFDISWFYLGLEKVGYTVARNSICRLVGIIALFTYVKCKEDLVLYMFLNSTIQMLGNLSMWTYIRREVNAIPINTLSFARHLYNTATYFVVNVAVSIYTVLDKVLLGYITGDHFQNGYYEQAHKVIGMAEALSYAALNGVMGARQSYLFAKKRNEEAKQWIKKTSDIILFICIALVFGIWSVSNNFVPVFFGDGYGPVVPLLCMMAPLIYVTSLTTCLGRQYYIPCGRINFTSKIIIKGAVINLFANLILIPIYGAEGAVIGTLIGEGYIAFSYCYHGREYLPFEFIIRASYKRCFAGILMLVVSNIIAIYVNLGKPLVILLQIVSSIMVYLLSLYYMKDRLLRAAINIIWIHASVTWKRF